MSVKPVQLPLDLAFRPATGRDDFMVAPCNEAAIALIDRYPDWPGPVAVLCGPPGSGKSHLLDVWRQSAGALVLDAAELRVQTLADQIGDGLAVAVDRAEAGAEPDCLFHLVNMIRERSGHLLIAVSAPPARWTFGTPDMRSRLAAAPLFELGAPDDSLLQAVLVKQFDDQGLVPGPDVLRFIQERMPRTFADARAVVAEMNQLSLAERRAMTVPLARNVMQKLGYL